MGSWVQDRTANLGITYTGGLCLQGVREAFGGTVAHFPTAMADWNSGGGNHPGEQPPDGVEVPIYLQLNNVAAGDVAISLGDGRVAACAQPGTHVGLYIYPSLDAYTEDYFKYNGGGTYLGWSEGVDTYRVVHYQPTITNEDVTVTNPIAYTTTNVNDSTIPVGQTTVVTPGVNGEETIIYLVSYSDGTETGRSVISDTTVPPVDEVIHVGTETPTPPEVPTVPPTGSNPTAPENPNGTASSQWAKFWSDLRKLLVGFFKEVKL